MEENNQQMLKESRITLNIKQTSKGAKYFDIKVRGDTLEEITNLYDETEKFAYEKGCIQL